MIKYSRYIMKTLLEAYHQVLLEQNTISLTNYKVKYSVEDKKKQQVRLAYKKVEEYIKNGSQGDLDLNGTPITQLPAGLKVGGYLNLSSTQITQLPAGLKVGGYLNLSSTQITQLPADLKIEGSLYIYETPITQLPAGLKVRGDLFLHNTQIAKLPADLEVGRDLYLERTPIAKKYTADQLKQMLPGVRGGISV